MTGRAHQPPPQGPLVIDTHDLPRRAGASHRIDREVPAPAGLGGGLFGVPVGAPLRLEVLLESVVEGVYVSATVVTEAAGECGYCLEPDRAPLTVEVDELFAYEAERPGRRPTPGQLDDGDADEDLPRLVEGFADLEPSVRDAVVLALPFSRLCGEDCPRLAAARAPLVDEDGLVDPRWEQLRAGLDEPSPQD